MIGWLRDRICAFVVALVWGTTFMVSKHILDCGLRPMDLTLLRFVLAYLTLALFCRNRLEFRLDRREFCLLMVGLMGGSIYYILEYNALRHSSAVNVGLIVSTVPVASAMLHVLRGRQRVSIGFVVGSLVSILGVSMIVLNGHFELQPHFLGDLLAVGAVLSWSIYSYYLDELTGGVGEFETTRRLFFYGTISLVMIMLASGEGNGLIERVSQVDMRGWIGVGYLGLVASCACIWLWQLSFRMIGERNTNSYLYLLPIITAICGWMLNREEFTVWIGVGSMIVFFGLVIVGREKRS